MPEGALAPQRRAPARTPPLALRPQALYEPLVPALAEAPAGDALADPAAPRAGAAAPARASDPAPARAAAPTRTETMPLPGGAGEETGAAVSVQAVVDAVLTDLQQQAGRQLDVRLRAVLVPVLARLSEQLVAELRQELARALEDSVRRAVVQELRRQRAR
jgi:hypothetical protein